MLAPLHPIHLGNEHPTPDSLARRSRRCFPVFLSFSLPSLFEPSEVVAVGGFGIWAERSLGVVNVLVVRPSARDQNTVIATRFGSNEGLERRSPSSAGQGGGEFTLSRQGFLDVYQLVIKREKIISDCGVETLSCSHYSGLQII